MTVEKVELGRHLFYDTRLSGNGTYACASCHRQELAFTDGRATAIGSTGQRHRRNAMALANVVYNVSYNWSDPRLRTLEEQVRVPMFNEDPVELGLAGNEERVLERFREIPRDREMFRRAFPDDPQPVTIHNIVKAVACFERTLISGSSPYDRLVYGGEMSAMSDSARRGMRLFFSERLACAECHADFNFSGPLRHRATGPVEPAFHNNGLYDVDGQGAYPQKDRGLIDSTGRRKHMGHFRAPSLRNAARTAPYMHDGSVASLGEVIELYARGGRLVRSGPRSGDGARNRHKSRLLLGFELADGEKEDLIEFLESLTDESFITDPRLADPFDGDSAIPRFSVRSTSAPFRSLRRIASASR